MATTSISRSQLTRLITVLLTVITVVQGVIPNFPIDNVSTKALIESIFTFLVVGLTAWMQYLSVEIKNGAIWPTLAILFITILGGLNDFINIIPLSPVASQWVKLAISGISTIIALVSKMLWPTQESKIIEQTKSELTVPPPPNKPNP